MAGDQRSHVPSTGVLGTDDGAGSASSSFFFSSGDDGCLRNSRVKPLRNPPFLIRSPRSDPNRFTTRRPSPVHALRSGYWTGMNRSRSETAQRAGLIAVAAALAAALAAVGARPADRAPR